MAFSRDLSQGKGQAYTAYGPRELHQLQKMLQILDLA